MSVRDPVEDHQSICFPAQASPSESRAFWASWATLGPGGVGGHF
ncbi:uncharacterized protein G2W53_013188 [Senna tora]|uniref:Uncharacterized protein n=1 Tax=Senna tora TaxID=362788 RepID=A0A834WP86_9FABA|nr:uncharacterized protein G2W53_013188 [Senna tora]